MTTSATRWLAWLCVALYSLVGTAGTAGVVLCIESDGCIQIEIGRGDDCAGCDEEHAGEQATSCVCVDLPLAAGDHMPQRDAASLALHDAPPTLFVAIASDRDAREPRVAR